MSYMQQTKQFSEPAEEMPEDLKKVYTECKDEFDELVWFVNRAIQSADKFEGVCASPAVVKAESELAYYQPGKIFRFQNIINATAGELEAPQEGEEQPNVIYHIYSVSGRRVAPFLIPESPLDEKCKNTVLFAGGSSFLVCKREDIDGVAHIYLREVCLGLSRNVIVWVDENVHGEAMGHIHRLIKNAIHDDERSQYAHYILKSQSITAKAYLNSVFFEATMHLGDNFKFVQNLKRENERIVNLQDLGKAQPKYAGPKLLADILAAYKKLPEDIQERFATAVTDENEADAQ